MKDEEEKFSGDKFQNDDEEDVTDDLILSQEFFCTPDFITPECQSLNFDLDLDAEGSIPCPSAPEKPKSIGNKRSWHDGFDSWDDELPEAISLSDEYESEFLKGIYSSKKHNNYMSKSGGSGLSRYMNDFRECQKVGSGNFSCVFKVLSRKDGCLYAVKKSTESERSAMEVKTLSALGCHENIVHYCTSWTESGQLYIQMELCDGDLSKVSSSNLYTELEVLDLLHQMSKALEFVHNKRIVHLDVKPENIFVKNGIYKLGDFGCATFSDENYVIEEGDAQYIALEILNENYDHLDKADIFSLGATIYELVREKDLPLSGHLSSNLHEGNFPPIPGYTVQFQNLLKAMVNLDPVRRPSAQELVENVRVLMKAEEL